MCLLCIISLESLLSTWNNSVPNVLSCKRLSLLSTTTMELHLTVCMHCAKQITANKSVWSSQVTLVLQAELTVSSAHVFTKYFTRVLKQFSLGLVVPIKANSWVLAWPVSVWLFSLVPKNLDIIFVVIFEWSVLIPSGESLAVVSNIIAMFGVEIFIFHKVMCLEGHYCTCLCHSSWCSERGLASWDFWHECVEFEYTSIVYTCVGKYSWKHISNAHWVNSEEWMKWWKL